MPVKVYFGPYKHSPAEELPLDERLLWLTDMHLLHGVERDFWTSNPLHLDVFRREQVRVWLGELRCWCELGAAAALILGKQGEPNQIDQLPNGKLALGLELAKAFREAQARAENVADIEPG